MKHFTVGNRVAWKKEGARRALFGRPLWRLLLLRHREGDDALVPIVIDGPHAEEEVVLGDSRVLGPWLSRRLRVSIRLMMRPIFSAGWLALVFV
jgi:hypothetical protein